ncbi:GCN5-related N-acetyltransferase [Gemmatirosa kalamazoonensis]|uniref:GCN5-related N-acetyltransferase n=1 Tax=Gemmatirosa kalamazoonensis TaxID=861299 RepID=W0RHI9_9BACT|nr:GNAT family N-acetyltransferase [Gemmatirosa kalamazoonensis]AHG88868.1 GCN5-related N-acetyltransferase [Gemmatirosa kalamazoonensis]
MTPSRDVLTGAVAVRRAVPNDVPGIAALVAEWAEEEILLPRTAADVARAVDDYVVAVDARGRVLACGALREYSPSLAELVSLAVARDAHGRGLGRLVVAAVERLALARGHASLFAHTVSSEFFEAVGYDRADRSLYPEKTGRSHTVCMHRSLLVEVEGLAVAA